MSRFRSITVAAAAAGMILCAQLNAAPIIYPANGQSVEQQQADMAECNNWSVQSVGFDPARPPPPPTAQPQAQATQGGVARGAVRGAALGEVVADDWKSGAAAGALVGGFRRADQSRQQQAQQQQADQQYQQQLAAGQDAYDRALGACMTGRGYTVN